MRVEAVLLLPDGPGRFELQTIGVLAVCVLVLLCVPLILALPLVQNAETDDLIFVNLIFRHGARAPDVASSEQMTSKFLYGSGQLTEQGITESYKLGNDLRTRYINTGYLSKVIDVKEFQMRSPNIERCLASGVAVGQGMYSTPERRYPLPIAVMGQDINNDDLLAPQWHNCKRNTAIFKAKCPSYVVQQKYIDFFVECFKCLGWDKKAKNFTTPESARKIEGIVNEYLANVATEPERVVNEAKIIYQDVQAYSTGVFPHADPALAALHANDVMYNWFKRFDDAIECSKTISTNKQCKLKLYAYSSQDFMINTVLEMLDLKAATLGKTSPKFSSALSLELHRRNDTTFYIKVLYRDGPLDPEFRDVTKLSGICNGVDKCPYENFVEAIKANIKPSRRTLCG